MSSMPSPEYQQDFIVRFMLLKGMTMDRETYLSLAYPVDDERPEDIDEDLLPPEFRLTGHPNPDD